MDSIDEAWRLLKAHRLEHPELVVDDAISHLQQLGHSKIDCIGTVAKILEMPHSEAKRVVHLSPAWEFRRKIDEDFHDTLFAELDSEA